MKKYDELGFRFRCSRLERLVYCHPISISVSSKQINGMEFIVSEMGFFMVANALALSVFFINLAQPQIL